MKMLFAVAAALLVLTAVAADFALRPIVALPRPPAPDLSGEVRDLRERLASAEKDRDQSLGDLESARLNLEAVTAERDALAADAKTLAEKDKAIADARVESVMRVEEEACKARLFNGGAANLLYQAVQP